MSKNTGKRKRAKAKRRKIVFLLSFLLLAVGLVCGLSLTVFFPVKNIVASGSGIYTAEEIVMASGITQEDNLLLLNQSTILNSIQKQLPFIESIELNRKLPETAVIKVKDVGTYLCFIEKDKVVRTDSSFRIIPEGLETAKYQLSVVCDWNTAENGEFVVLSNSDDIDMISQVLTVCRDKGLSIEFLDLLDKENIKMNVDGRFEVLFGNKYDFAGKFSQLIAMIERIEQGKTGRIDLSAWSSDNTRGYFVESDLE